MDYKELINQLREHGFERDPEIYCTAFECGAFHLCDIAATAIETLLAEREAAIADLTSICEDSGDACHLCKHLPCVDKNGNGRCIGWQWRGPTPPDRQQTES